MTHSTAAVAKPQAAATQRPVSGRPGADLVSFLFLSAWCGLIAGLLEVGAIVVRRQVLDADHFYRMSRHFVWLTPLVNLALFLLVGLLGCAVILVWRRRGQWVFTRILIALSILPALLVVFSRIYSLAWVAVALGIAARLVPLIERSGRDLRRLVWLSFPAAVAIWASLGGSLWVGDRIKQERENARPLPPRGSPNILLIVLDTVAACHLSLHGYDRPTSPTLLELAGRGIVFETARATSSWTLPSHATMLTGRWFHELPAGWLTPLGVQYPSLAAWLGDRGYATAGFVANTIYCGTDSGLARGFTSYQDYIFPQLTFLETAELVNRALEGVRKVTFLAEDWLAAAGLLPDVKRFLRSLDNNRKEAAEVNRELLDWLAQRARPERPFFAFLNYYDAHHPYELPRGRLHRFGTEPSDDHERMLIHDWADIDKETVSPQGVAFAAAAYDDCVADLDERIGMLIDELHQRGVLKQTWLIITADHGEGFAEHAGYFGHGTSLYDTEVHVPLLIVPPGGRATKRVVKQPVSLRNLAATMIDLAGQSPGSPFPGHSLAGYWNQDPPAVPIQPIAVSPSLAELVPNNRKMRDFLDRPIRLPALGAVKDGEWSYIRRELPIHEALFHIRSDPGEQHNLASDPAAQMTLQRMRAALNELTGGPLVTERFSR